MRASYKAAGSGTGFAMMFLLAGCISQPEPEKVYIKVPVRVEMPVPIPCPVELPAGKRYETKRLKKSDTDFDKIRAVLIELRQRAATEEELRALLGVCLGS